MLTASQTKNFVIPLIFCKILFTNGCGSDQDSISKPSKEISNELQELKRLKKEFKLQRISHIEYIDKSRLALNKLQKQYKQKKIEVSNEVMAHTNAVVNAANEYSKMPNQYTALLIGLNTKNLLREVCDSKKVNSNLKLFLKNKIISLEDYNKAKIVVRFQNQKFADEDLGNLLRTFEAGRIFKKKIKPKLLIKIRQIIKTARDNEIMDSKAANHINEALARLNQKKDLRDFQDFQKISSLILEKLETKKEINQKIIDKFKALVQDGHWDKLTTDILIEFIDNFNKNIKVNSAKQTETNDRWKKIFKHITQTKLELDLSYLPESFKTQFLPDVVKSKKKKRKTLKSNKISKTKKALEQIKNILNEHNLGEIKLYTLAKSKIIEKEILIGTIKFFDRLNINKINSLNKEEINAIKKVKSFVREYGFIAIVQNHITSEQFSIDEINYLINVLSKLKR